VTMRLRALVALAALCLASTAAAQETLTLKNGDRLTGTLTAIAGGTWVFKHAGGELKVAAGDVAAYVTSAPVGLRLADGTIVAATVTAAGDRLQLVAASGVTRAITPADLAAVGDPSRLEMLRPIRIGYFSPFAKFWGATVGFGFSNKTGNGRSRGLSGDIGIERSTSKDRIQLGFGIAQQRATPYADSALVPTVAKLYGNGRVDVFFSGRVFAFAATTQERDTLQNLDLRSAYNGGLGYQVFALPNTDFRENFHVPDSVSATPIVGAGTALKQKLGPIDFQWNFDWAPSTENFKDYRILSTSSLTTTIIKGLGFRVASRNEVNNNPPGDAKKHDWLLTSALTYSLGR
jgi:putative salt-induced outer membrane protein YdiY